MPGTPLWRVGDTSYARAGPGVPRSGRIAAAQAQVAWLYAQGCDPDGAVRLQSLADGNHEWPGGADRAYIAGTPSDALAATPTALDFFLAHPQTA